MNGLVSEITDAIRKAVTLRLTPRTFLTSIGMSAMVCLVFIDQTGPWRRNTAASVEAVQTQLVTMRSLSEDTSGQDLQQRVDQSWTPLEKSLLTEKTKGLNSARLQKAVADALGKCGVSNVYMDIDDRPSDREGYVIYTVSVRSRDRQRNFPTCLLELQNLDVRLVIESMDWAQANGAFRISLKAVGRQA